jgi:hypothetical protein
MHQFFAPLPGDHNKRVILSKKTKTAVKRAFGGYPSKFIHEIAQDSQDVQRKLDFVYVIPHLSLMFGNSSDYGYKRQLMSSSCFRKEPSYDFKEDKENKIKQVLPNEDNEFKDQPVFPSKATSKVISVLRGKHYGPWEKEREEMPKVTHRGRVLLCIMPPYCIISSVTFLMRQSKFPYFLVN